MTVIKTLAVVGLLLAMMFSLSLSYPHSEEYVDEDRMETIRSEGKTSHMQVLVCMITQFFFRGNDAAVFPKNG